MNIFAKTTPNIKRDVMASDFFMFPSHQISPFTKFYRFDCGLFLHVELR